MFASIVKAFISSVVTERRKLNALNLSRTNRLCTETDCATLMRYISHYTFTDVQMARFLLRHANMLKYIMPGAGSNNHESRMQKFMLLIDKSQQIINEMDKEKFFYYRITNDNGEAYIKTSHKRCVVIHTLHWDGSLNINQYSQQYRRSTDDVVVEIPEKLFVEKYNQAVKQINKLVV